MINMKICCSFSFLKTQFNIQTILFPRNKYQIYIYLNKSSGPLPCCSCWDSDTNISAQSPPLTIFFKHTIIKTISGHLFKDFFGMLWCFLRLEESHYAFQRPQNKIKPYTLYHQFKTGQIAEWFLSLHLN